MKNSKSTGLRLVVVVVLLSGCSSTVDKIDDLQKTTSPDSQVITPPRIKAPSIKKSTVYFYRPDQSVSGWTWKDISIIEIHAIGIITDPDETSQVSHIGNLKNNSYFKKEFAPGIHRFTANWKLIPYVFTVKPDEDLCIKVEIDLVDALRQRATLKIIDKSTCDSEIMNTKEMLEKMGSDK